MRLRIPLLAIAAAAALPAPAVASTKLSYNASTGLLVQGDAVGESLQVNLLSDPRRFTFTRLTTTSPNNEPIAAATLVAGTGCTATDTGSVECSAPGSVVVTARLADGDDFIGLAGEPADGFLDGEAGDDVVAGGRGFDAIAGSEGGDRLFGGGGNDVVEGGDGADHIGGDGFTDGAGGSDILRGGSGNDTFRARLTAAPHPDRFEGGAGADVADYSNRTAPVHLSTKLTGAPDPPNDGAPNEGDDLVGVETLLGGSGNDALLVTGPQLGIPLFTQTLRGNDGNDSLRIIGNARGSFDPGLGQDIVLGSAAADTIFIRDGEPDLGGCGGGTDIMTADLRDNPPSSCENVDQGAVREGPNVRIRSARRAARGMLAVRLHCPRSLRRACAGTLRAGSRRATRYRIRPRRSATVHVRFASRARTARLRSVERGIHGPKTTLRALRVRAR